jgi:hypothetical protein
LGCFGTLSFLLSLFDVSLSVFNSSGSPDSRNVLVDDKRAPIRCL